MTFTEIFYKYWEFAEKTFDTSETEALIGLKREIKELEDLWSNSLSIDVDHELEEMADIQFYLWYVIKKSGYNLDEFINAMEQKLEVLKTRKWKKDETGCYSHIK